MIEPLSLFDTPLSDPPRARSSDPATSHQAAARAKIKAGSNRARALAALASAGDEGLTDFELADRTGVQQTSIGCRRKELERAELVEFAGVTRPSPTDSPARVYRPTVAGRVLAQELASAAA